MTSESRNKLKKFAEELRLLRQHEHETKSLPLISPALVHFIAGGIERFLANECSLEEAFGLPPPKRGRRLTKATRDKQFKLVEKIFWAEFRGLSWNEIAEELKI